MNFKTYLEYNSENLVNVDNSIFNIPHSSPIIPKGWDGDRNKLDNEILMRTDWYSDRIFDVYGATRLIADFSRIFCDVDVEFPEKYEESTIDDNTYMKKDMLYAKDIHGKQLTSFEKLDKIYYEFYLPYQKKLEKLIQDKLGQTNGNVYLINCHTYSNTTKGPLSLGMERPEILLCTDETQTPQYLINQIKSNFENFNYEVGINKPFSGTKIPKVFKNSKRVKSIRIEINRKLFTKKDKGSWFINLSEVLRLTNIIENIFQN